MTHGFDVSHLPEVIRAMLSPSFYPHETAAAIDLVQTHISYVLLTGPYAYKVKKPVNFGFLDFETLERRKHFCEEELRLNRLFAPELYLDVVTICGADGRFWIDDGSGGTAIEFAVKMRQFREADLLLHVFERGELREPDVEEIGRLIARVHGAAHTDARIAAYGTVDTMAGVVEDNFAVVAPHVGRIVPRGRLDVMHRYATSFLRDARALFAQRIDAGMIRECHGDLHLRNICFFEGKIELFDRIEFNEAFKNIDVMYDLAFLLMDLEFRGAGEYANRLLNVYLEETGDYEGVQLLRFYMAVRAQIRAKVLALELGEEEIPEEEMPGIALDARKYLDLAYVYSTKPVRGCIVMMCGVSGTGKSTVARGIAMRMGAVQIRSDVIRKHLAGVPLREHRDDIYTAEWNARTYARLLALGLELADAGWAVVLDAKYDVRALRAEVMEEAAARGVPVRIVVCEADEAELRRRLVERVGDVSDAGVSLLDAQLRAFEGLTGEEERLAVKVDTGKAVDWEGLVGGFELERTKRT